MNLFSQWFLFPNLELGYCHLKQFQKGQKKNLEIFVLSSKEVDFYQTEYHYAVTLFGELRPKVLYPLNKEASAYVFIFPKDEPQKLSSHIAPGKAHIASHFGALLGPSLVALGVQHKTQFSFLIRFSEGLKIQLQDQQHEFIVGLLQKTITNKIFKKNFSHQDHFLEKKSILFLEEPFFFEANYLRAMAICDAMCYTRTFINMPANILNPETYEFYLRALVKQESAKAKTPNYIQIEIMDYEKLKEQSCGLICAVGQGSHIKPKIIKLTYSPFKKVPKKTLHVALVGKGITFDSGGYDLKPSSGMRLMKKDMGGSAAALGIFFACARLGLPVRLSCWIVLAENMVSGGAMRPGDVYRARNGFYVEIENTDAEGRLVLADTLSLVCEEKPDWVIDLATLTGAARVSLGPLVDSLFGNNPETLDLLYQSGVETGDWVWNFPLLQDYACYFDSNVSDFMNSGSSGFAGSVTAALFLQKFVTLNNWSHIDTYMWCDRPASLWAEGSGPTAKCVRLVTKAIETFISKKTELT
jgi:leucyl aminopeptidase